MQRYPRIVKNPLDNGSPMPNPKNRGIYPYYLLPDAINGSTDITLAALSSTERAFSNNLGGVLEVHALVGNATSTDYTVKFIDNGSQRVWSQNNLHSETVVGTRTFPYRLPHKFYLLPGESIGLVIQDRSNAANTISLCFYCQKYELADLYFGKNYQDELKIKKPYFYTTAASPVVVPLSSSATSNFTISTESHFWLKQITQRSTGTYNIKIIQNRTEKGFQSNTLKSVLFAGNSQNYFEFKDGEEVFIESNSFIEIQLTDTSAAQNSVFITFGGINIYI